MVDELAAEGITTDIAFQIVMNTETKYGNIENDVSFLNSDARSAMKERYGGIVVISIMSLILICFA